MENEARFFLDADRFPPGDRPALAKAIADQGNEQISHGAVNTMLDKQGQITVIVRPGNHWLRAVGFQAAVEHWFASR